MADDMKKDVKSFRRGGKNRPRNYGSKDEPTKTGYSKTDWSNDPAWYAVNPQLLKDAASLAFANVQGGHLYCGLDVSDMPAFFRLTGVMRIPFIPTIGRCIGPDSAFNLAVRNLYTFVRHANSGHTNYESGDMGMYILAVASAMSLVAHIERIYGTAFAYSIKNRALPRTVMTALGVRATSLSTGLSFQAHLASIRTRLNVQIMRLQSVCMPRDFSFLQRWVYLNSHTWKDCDSEKATIYVPFQAGWYRFNAATATNGGCLTMISGKDNAGNWTCCPITKYDYVVGGVHYRNFINDLFDIEELLDLLTYLIDPIVEDEDMNIMSGDILKAFGAEKLVKLALLPDSYILYPEYSKDILHQIHNMRWYDLNLTGQGAAANFNNLGSAFPDDPAVIVPLADRSCVAVYQSGGSAFQVLGSVWPQFGFNSNVNNKPIPAVTKENYSAWIDAYQSGTGFGDKPFNILPPEEILDIYDDDITPEKVMEATRFKFDTEMYTTPSGGDWSGLSVMLDNHGTEITLSPSVIQPDGTIVYIRRFPYTSQTVAVGDMQALSQCDFAPLIPHIVITLAGNADERTATVRYQNAVYAYAPLDNFTVINYSDKLKMNEVALYSEFVCRAEGNIFLPH